MLPPTSTEPLQPDWAIDDPILRLRVWGTDRSHRLPAPGPSAEWTVGSSPQCALQLRDGEGLVARRHARFLRSEGHWAIQDLGSPHGVLVDGVRCTQALLAPGIELQLGGVVLVAESELSIALRSYVSRLLGWSTERLVAVDLALRALRTAAARRAALVLCGPDDLAPLARRLHERTLGADRPFVLCDPKRRAAEGPAPETLDRAVPALHAAAGGTACLRGERLPPDFAEALTLWHRPDTRTQLVVCARNPMRSDSYVTTAIDIPPLSQRAKELRRIIDEYADDAAALLGAPPEACTLRDRDWIRAQAATSLAEIDKAVLRLIAVRTSPSINQAAERLGMSHAALSRWLERKRLAP